MEIGHSGSLMNFLILTMIHRFTYENTLILNDEPVQVYNKLDSNSYTLSGVLAAAFIAGILTLLFNVFSFCVLLG